MKKYRNIPEQEISVAAYYIWKDKNPYEVLCWLLAERQLYIEINFVKPSFLQIAERAEKIFSSEIPYDVLCWEIGLSNLIIQKNTSIDNLNSIFRD
ncbi:MAG: hypothetical protein GF383_08840 [Candidatus Lokiarchaeota archaeon]|nr:hypothetical protein [Candidatus Lokiarchaeota archaeon]MBD3340489.1 hypothetical protein [Candidatus Lokiarchaeota archaeon]